MDINHLDQIEIPVPFPLAELTAEHARLRCLVTAARAHLGRGDEPGLRGVVAELACVLGSHHAREENGIYTQLAANIVVPDRLRAEHKAVEAAILDLDPRSLLSTLDALETHMWEEDHLWFPMAGATFENCDWERIVRVTHVRVPERRETANAVRVTAGR